jgi:hypothetical protein
MKRTILAAVATGLVATAMLGGTWGPPRHHCPTGSCTPVRPALAAPAGGGSVALATYALAAPTIGSVDLLDCVGFPVGFPIYLKGLLGTGWSIDSGSIAIDVPAPVFALA